MNVDYIDVEKILINKRNPRKISKKNLQLLKDSVQQFPEMLTIRPIIIDENNTIIGGTQRYIALKELGYKKIPVYKITDLTEEQKIQFMIKDNVTYGDFDKLILEKEFDINFLKNINIPNLNFILGSKELNFYVQDIKTPVYKPTMPKPPSLKSCFFTDLYEKKLEIIKNANLENKELEYFLILAASRFIVFNFAKIAEYYAHLKDEKIKELFKQLVLIIIDYNDYIENSYINLFKFLNNED